MKQLFLFTADSGFYLFHFNVDTLNFRCQCDIVNIFSRQFFNLLGLIYLC